MSYNRSKSEKCRAVMNRRWSDRGPFWREKILAQESEGISIEQFCLREGLCKTSFFKWRKRLFHSNTVNSGSAVDFIEVKSDKLSSVSLALTYPDGLEVSVSGLSVTSVENLLQSLRADAILKRQ